MRSGWACVKERKKNPINTPGGTPCDKARFEYAFFKCIVYAEIIKATLPNSKYVIMFIIFFKTL